MTGVVVDGVFTLPRRLDQHLGPRLTGRGALEVLVGVFDHYDGAVDHRPNGDGDAAKAHDVSPEPEHPHGSEGHENTDRQH